MREFASRGDSPRVDVGTGVVGPVRMGDVASVKDCHPSQKVRDRPQGLAGDSDQSEYGD